MNDIVDRANNETEHWLECQIQAMHHDATTNTNCVDCSEPIGANRKKYVPWATRCINCQREHEEGRQ